jgi:hypothetical protein
MAIFIFCGHYGTFFPFWYVVPRKIWQSCYTTEKSEAVALGARPVQEDAGRQGQQCHG